MYMFAIYRELLSKQHTASYYSTQRVQELASVENPPQVKRMEREEDRLTPELIYLGPSGLAVSKSAKKGEGFLNRCFKICLYLRFFLNLPKCRCYREFM